jgi:hypothetical protein
MILTPTNKGRNCQVFDGCDSKISFVAQYNTKTKEVTVYIPTYGKDKLRFVMGSDKNEMWPVHVTFKVPGSYALDQKGRVVK